jgi:hypothetical protein
LIFCFPQSDPWHSVVRALSKVLITPLEFVFVQGFPECISLSKVFLAMSNRLTKLSGFRDWRSLRTMEIPRPVQSCHSDFVWSNSQIGFVIVGRDREISDRCLRRGGVDDSPFPQRRKSAKSDRVWPGSSDGLHFRKERIGSNHRELRTGKQKSSKSLAQP